jgi:hypothetical protein
VPPQPLSTQPVTDNNQRNILRQQIDRSLQKAEVQRNQLKTLDRQFNITNIILTSLAAFITGQGALTGEAPIANWRTTALVASALASGSALVMGVHQQIASADTLAEAKESVAKLKALKVSTIPETYNLEQVALEYQKLLSSFQRVDF